MSTISTGNFPLFPNQFEIKSLDGDSEIKQLDSLAELVENYLKGVFPSHNKLMLRIYKKEEGVVCRILYDQEKIVGMVIFRNRETKKFKHQDVKKCLRIYALFSFVQEKKAVNSYLHALLDEVCKTAIEIKAETIGIEMGPHALTRGFLFENDFDVKHEHKDVLLMVRKVEESKKRILGVEKKDSISKRRIIEIDQMPQTPKEPSLRGKISPVISRDRNAPPLIHDVSKPDVRLMLLKKRTEAPPRLTSTTIQMKYLRLIADGSKTIEGRINHGMFANCKEGERIQFFCQHEKVLCDILKIVKYGSFDEMLKREGYQTCLPDVTSYEAACAIYRSIPSYTERAAKYGVIALHIRLV